ncbi:MAG: hypothetical protein E6R03_00780 [Hyphomicrobiaceae bacterium]|nr:MAG: hypothetical protein E6R03_00780 [Hyphomicrobiaceae bacterium]
MTTALKLAPTPTAVTSKDILENIQDMPCPYVASFTFVDRVPLPSAPERNLDQDLKAMLADRGLSAREVDAVYQHATSTWLEVSGRTDADGMTAQLTITEGMCDLFLAMRKMR